MRCRAMWDEEAIVYLPCICMHATEKGLFLLVQAETVILWLQLLRTHVP